MMFVAFTQASWKLGSSAVVEAVFLNHRAVKVPQLDLGNKGLRHPDRGSFHKANAFMGISCKCRP